MLKTPFSSSITINLDENDINSSNVMKEASVPINNSFNLFFDDYEAENNIQHKKVHYLFHGRLIKGNDTPSSLKMKNGDTIQILNSSTNFSNSINKSAKIVLILVDPNGCEHQSEIKIERKIKDWLKNRCAVLELDFDSLAFFINNKIIDIERTPHQMKLKNNDKIFAKYKVNSPSADSVSTRCQETQEKCYSPPTNTTPLEKYENLISIDIELPNGEILKEQVNPSATFKDTFRHLLKKHQIRASDYHYFYYSLCLSGVDTPNNLQMKDGDTIIMKKKIRTSENSFSRSNSNSTCLLI